PAIHGQGDTSNATCGLGGKSQQGPTSPSGLPQRPMGTRPVDRCLISRSACTAAVNGLSNGPGRIASTDTLGQLLTFCYNDSRNKSCQPGHTRSRTWHQGGPVHGVDT